MAKEREDTCDRVGADVATFEWGPPLKELGVLRSCRRFQSQLDGLRVGDGPYIEVIAAKHTVPRGTINIGTHTGVHVASRWTIDHGN